MKTYEIIISPAKFGPGIVFQLDSEQSKVRRHVLEPVDEESGVWRSTAPLEFKAGECIGLSEAPPKNMAEIVVTPEKAAEVKDSAATASKRAASASSRRRK